MPARDLPEFRRGRRPAAVDLSAVAAEARRLGRLTVGAGLDLQDGPTGRHVAIGGIRPVPILLSGSSSPYTGVEAYRVSGAWVTLPGGRSFPKVVEANGVAGLAGKVVLARLCGVDGSAVVEWCFQAVKRGVAGPPTYPCTACSGGSGGVLPDTVYLTDPNKANWPLTYQGATKDCWTGCYTLPAATRVTNDGACSTFTAGSTLGVYYRLACVPGGIGATIPAFSLELWYKACAPSGFTAYQTVASDCSTEPWSTNPHGVATVSAPSLVTAVSPATPCNTAVIFNLQDDSGDTFATSNAFNLFGSTAGGSGAVNVCISTSATGCPGTLVVPVTGCNGLALPGATVKLSNGATAITNSSGDANLVVPPGTYSITSVSCTRFTTRTTGLGSYTVTANATTTATAIALSAASGFVCIAGTVTPTKTTLSFTDSNGTHTNGLVWNATTLRWNGCYTKSIAGARTSAQCASGATTSTLAIPIHFSMDQNLSMKVDYSGCASTSPNPAVPTNLTCAGWPWAANQTYSSTATLSGTLSPLSVSNSFTLPSGATPTIGGLINGTLSVTE